MATTPMRAHSLVWPTKELTRPVSKTCVTMDAVALGSRCAMGQIKSRPLA